MNIACYDIDGNLIKALTQWDINQKIVIKNILLNNTPEVHFCNTKSNLALIGASTYSDGELITEVPNILLQENLQITIYIYESRGDGSAKTTYAIRIPVNSRPKPADYEYSDNAQFITYKKLQEALEQSTEVIELANQAIERANQAVSLAEKAISSINTTDSFLDENSTNAIQNAVVAKEVQDLKKQLHGVRLTYSHNIDNYNQPKIEKTYTTTTTTGERTYFATFSYWCTLAAIEEDAETKEKNFIPRLTNIPPLNYWIDGDGHERYDYNCEFTKEYLILDYSKIDETSTLKEEVDLSALEEVVIELGGTLRRTIRKDYMNSSVWTIVYEYTATFKDEATRDTFYNEFLMLAKLGTEAFISEYTYSSEPMELTAEVIDNA